MDIIDSHAHLFMEAFDEDYEGVLERARQAGVTRIVNVGLETETNREVLRALAKTTGLHPAVGWHPHEALNFTEACLPELERQLNLPEVVAFGEIGLDYHWGRDYIPAQKKALSRLIELAEGSGKPVIIHCREAWEDFFDLIAPHRASLKEILLHCYSGNLADTKRALDLGCHFSYAGAITFKNSADLRATVPPIPLERLLIETDAPYLAPHPRRGKRNEPALLTYHAEALGQILDLSPAEVAQLTADNARRLFNFTGPGLPIPDLPIQDLLAPDLPTPDLPIQDPLVPGPAKGAQRKSHEDV
ncbi:MAG: TatD family hydrolase [Deltaproteobacteria bacterium]|jgi:TatD DNase family protein|nr:TatD family hydrolase [Deltaproteobacteria bacterium]